MSAAYLVNACKELKSVLLRDHIGELDLSERIAIADVATGLLATSVHEMPNAHAIEMLESVFGFSDDILIMRLLIALSMVNAHHGDETFSTTDQIELIPKADDEDDDEESEVEE